MVRRRQRGQGHHERRRTARAQLQPRTGRVLSNVRKWFIEVAKQVVRDRPGELLVKSALPGATVQLDGRQMDVAPVLINRVLPGKHIIFAKVDGVPPFGRREVEAKKKTEFRDGLRRRAGRRGSR